MILHAFSILIVVPVLSFLAPSAHASAVFGSADSYGVLAGTTVTDVATSATGITGNMGVLSGRACTGFVAGTGCTTPPGDGTVSGVANLANVAAMTAIDNHCRFAPADPADAMAAYHALHASGARQHTEGRRLGDPPNTVLIVHSGCLFF
jgi:hypothetical protein